MNEPALVLLAAMGAVVFAGLVYEFLCLGHDTAIIAKRWWHGQH